MLTRNVPSPDSLLFAVPWAEHGRWIWDSIPTLRGGGVLPLHGRGGRGLREIRTAFRQRDRILNSTVVFTWELRCTLAVALVRRRIRRGPRLVAVAPVVKGAWARHRTATAALLSKAERVVWMSSWERETWLERLSLPTDRMLVDHVPGLRPRVRKPVRDCLEVDAPLIALGDSNRDWQTLVRSFETLEGTSRIVASRPPRMTGLGNLHWTGPLPEETALSLLSESGIHVLCLRQSDYACGQSALVRALMEGIPTVATDLPVLREYFPESGVTRVPVGAPLAVADAVRHWRADPEAWRRARSDAFEFASRFEHAPFARRMARIARELA